MQTLNLALALFLLLNLGAGMWRVVSGPTAADRIMAIEILGVLIVGLTALFSRTLVVATPMLGWGLWFLFIHAILAITLPPWAYATSAFISATFGISIMLKGLQMFTYETEVGNLDQFA